MRIERVFFRNWYHDTHHRQLISMTKVHRRNVLVLPSDKGQAHDFSLLSSITVPQFFKDSEALWQMIRTLIQCKQLFASNTFPRVVVVTNIQFPKDHSKPPRQVDGNSYIRLCSRSPPGSFCFKCQRPSSRSPRSRSYPPLSEDHGCHAMLQNTTVPQLLTRFGGEDLQSVLFLFPGATVVQFVR